MGEVINLRRARKRRLRDEAAARAADNRARHGRTKAQKQRDAVETDEARRKLEALRLERERDN